MCLTRAALHWRSTGGALRGFLGNGPGAYRANLPLAWLGAGWPLHPESPRACLVYRVENTFRAQVVALLLWFRPLLDLLPPPRHPERLPRILEPLLAVDNSPILSRIACPSLVIGGAEDRVMAPVIQREMAKMIPDGRLKLHPGYGHGNHLENPDYTRQVDEFVRRVWRDGLDPPQAA